MRYVLFLIMITVNFLKGEFPGLKEKYENGNFVNEEGKIIGKHHGYPFYTIGQRKGLEIAVGEPLYVKEINQENNSVILAERKSLYKNEMIVRDYNGIKYGEPINDLKVTTKVRYRDRGAKSKLITNYELGIRNLVKVVFEEGIFAVTSGQSAVFYEGEDIVGGGIIV